MTEMERIFRRRWQYIRQRCYNPKATSYKNYGARGIRICRDWLDVGNFVEWCRETYKPGLTIDRKDPNKGYSPSNCRWATRSEQALNQRNTPAARLQRKNWSRSGTLAKKERYGDPLKRRKKFCPACKIFKELKFFSACASTVDGVWSYCKPCDNNRKKKGVL